MAHWGEGEAGQGTLLTGDIIQVVPDRRYVSFMRSFPNYIPLSEAAVRRISGAVKAYAFETIYGAWWDAIVKHDARSALQRSVDRYVAALREP